jgi:thiopeptide-type bacteriocin biosynthesis protein
VREHLRDEEALHPDVTFAELVFLPEGRVGNVLCRPVLRDYELVVMGRSGAPPSQQLPLSDLLVTVDESGSILLYSQKLERIVLPRLTNAHGFRNPRLPAAYRFLTALQAQTGCTFSWGPAASARVLPRVRIGRVVLSLAQWQLTKAETARLSGGLDGFLSMQAIRHEKGLPQWVVLVQGDNQLPVDLDNPLSVDAFMQVIKGSDGTILTELYPSPDKLVTTGPEGAYAHEIVLPCVRKALVAVPPATSSARVLARAKLDASPGERLFPPGSEWVYLKLYGGQSAIEEFIATELSATIREAQERQLIDHWFYIRYRDPYDHVRVRCRCRHTDNVGAVLRGFHERSGHLLTSGVLWKIEIDTYQRELERYKGVAATQASEQVFAADSDAAVAILGALHAAGIDEGAAGKRLRQHICVLGVHRLLLDCGLSVVDRHALVRRMHDAMWGHQHASQKQQLADRFREQRRSLENLLRGQVQSHRVLTDAQAAYDRRSARVAPIIQALRARPTIQAPELSDLASSYVHLHVNRLFPMPARTIEGLVCDLLWKLYESEAAQQKAAARVRTDSEEAVTAEAVPHGI